MVAMYSCVHSKDALVYKGHISNIGLNTIEYTCIETSLFMWAILYPYRTSLYPVLFYASSLSEPQKSKSCWYQYKSSNNFVTYVNFLRWTERLEENFQFRLRGSKEKPFGNINFCQVQRKYLLSMINVENLVSMIYWSLGMVFQNICL